MANGPDRATFWQKFIVQRCGFPKPELLITQFQNADLSDFCACGCNSFAVSVRGSPDVPPLAKRGGYGLVFEVDFKLPGEEQSLEILLFSGESGYLEYVEIDCCGNSFPVPENINVENAPYNVFLHKSLAL